MPKKRKSTTAQAAKRKVGAPADTSKEHTGTVIHSCLWGVCNKQRSTQVRTVVHSCLWGVLLEMLEYSLLT